MAIIKSLNLEVHLIPEVAEKIAKVTTDGADFVKIRAELHDSGAFQYGNKTCTVVFRENLPDDGLNPTVYDTRYVSVADFRGLVCRLLEDYYGENLERIV